MAPQETRLNSILRFIVPLAAAIDDTAALFDAAAFFGTIVTAVLVGFLFLVLLGDLFVRIRLRMIRPRLFGL